MSYRLSLLGLTLISLWLYTCKSPKTLEKVLFRPLSASIDTFSLDGIQVFHRFVPGEQISFRLLIKGGVENYPQPLNGIEHLALKGATECGTIFFGPTEIRNKLRETGSVFETETNLDFSSISVKCFAENFGPVFDLFAQMILWPTFEDQVFEQVRQREISLARQRELLLENTMGDSLKRDLFIGKPYEKLPLGTSTSLARIGRKEAKEYFNALVGRSRLVVVVVGGIEKERLREKLSLTLAELPKGFYASRQSEFIDPVSLSPGDGSRLTLLKGGEGRPGFACAWQLPPPGTRESLVMELALALLEIRMKQQLPLTPGNLRLEPNGLRKPFLSLVVRTTQPEETAIRVWGLLDQLIREGFTVEEFDAIRHTFMTLRILALQSTDAQADWIGKNLIYGSIDIFSRRDAGLLSCDLSEVNLVFKKYCKNLCWVFSSQKPLSERAAFERNPGAGD